MLPSRQAGLACNVFEKDGAFLDETAGGDGTALAVEYRRVTGCPLKVCFAVSDCVTATGRSMTELIK